VLHIRLPVRVDRSVEPVVLEIFALVLQCGNRGVTHVSSAREDPAIAHRLQGPEIVHQRTILRVRQLTESGDLLG